jgi:hypothetical protein
MALQQFSDQWLCLLCSPCRSGSAPGFRLWYDKSYTVGSKPGICRDNRPDSPPAGWNGTFFFIKILHAMQNFYEKDKKSTMLPQAVYVSSGETPGLMNHRVTPVV